MMLKSIISILKWLCGCNLKHCVYCEVTGEKCRKTSWRGGGPGGRRKKRTQNPVSCSERSAAVPSSACMLSHFSRVRLFVTPWTVAHQAPLSMGFFRQEYWSGLPFPPPGGLPDPGIELWSLNISCIGRWVLYQEKRQYALTWNRGVWVTLHFGRGKV